MTIASGLLKVTTWLKQSALGSASAGAGGSTARRVTSIFKADRDTFESNEIVDHHQSTGLSYGLKKADGVINGLLSAGTFAELIGSILEMDFATGVIEASATITYAGTTPNWTATGSADFLATGIKVGDTIRATTGSVTANNDRNFFVTGVTATVINFRALDGVTVSAGASTTTVLTVTGKKSIAPLTAHTTDYYTVEEYYADLTRSELFTDMVVSQVAFSLPASGNATINTSFVGLARSLSGAQVLTSPTTTSTPIMGAINGLIVVNAAIQANASGISFTITNAAANSGAVIGSNVGSDVNKGRIKVSGSFTALFESATISDLYDAETNVGISLVLTGDETGTADFVGVTMSRIKITGDAPDDGEKAIMRTYPFTAEINTAGGAALANDQTIISVQDSAA